MSETLDLFTAALVSGEPWQGDSLGFRRGGGSGWICTWISREGACAVPGCEQGSCPVHDAEAETQRHMDFSQSRAFLHARVPRR